MIPDGVSCWPISTDRRGYRNRNRRFRRAAKGLRHGTRRAKPRKAWQIFPDAVFQGADRDIRAGSVGKRVWHYRNAAS